MKSILLTFLIMSSSVFAQDLTFTCSTTYNQEKIWSKQVSLGLTSVTFGAVEDFKFHLQRKTDGRIELQASNMEEPSRSYATANIKDAGDNIELSIWTNFYVMDVRCQLK